jgi:hypothetical protein
MEFVWQNVWSSSRLKTKFKFIKNMKLYNNKNKKITGIALAIILLILLILKILYF